jgi:hypothetical protein
VHFAYKKEKAINLIGAQQLICVRIASSSSGAASSTPHIMSVVPNNDPLR